MNDDEMLPTDDDAPAGAPTDDAPVATATEEAPLAPGDDAPDSGPLADSPPVVDERPKEVVRGISPELLCQCPECDPDFVELQWFSPEEEKKVKGDAMLFCARSSRKYFTPVENLHAWIMEKGGPRKARRGSGN